MIIIIVDIIIIIIMINILVIIINIIINCFGEVKKKLLRRPLLEDAFLKKSRNAGFKGVVR